MSERDARGPEEHEQRHDGLLFARTCVGVTDLVHDAVIERDCVARR